MQRLYSSTEVAEIVGLDDSHVRRLARESKGKIGVQYGRNWLFSKAHIAALWKRRPLGTNTPKKLTPPEESAIKVVSKKPRRQQPKRS